MVLTRSVVIRCMLGCWWPCLVLESFRTPGGPAWCQFLSSPMWVAMWSPWRNAIWKRNFPKNGEIMLPKRRAGASNESKQRNIPAEYVRNDQILVLPGWLFWQRSLLLICHKLSIVLQPERLDNAQDADADDGKKKRACYCSPGNCEFSMFYYLDSSHQILQEKWNFNNTYDHSERWFVMESWAHATMVTDPFEHFFVQHDWSTISHLMKGF